jgi:hypothetical protein
MGQLDYDNSCGDFMIKFIEDYFHQCCPKCDSKDIKQEYLKDGYSATCLTCKHRCNYYDLLPIDKDHGPIKEGHVCKHGIRYPHECDECGDLIFNIITGKLPI